MQLAVVTGGAVRLGRAIALALAQQGYAIGLHAYRSQSASERTAAEIEALGVPVLRLSAEGYEGLHGKALPKSAMTELRYG